MAHSISTPAVRTILSLLFLFASFIRPDLFWTGLLLLVLILTLPLSLTLYLSCLCTLELLNAWAASPKCDPAERHVLRAFYWAALPGMLAHSVAGVVTARRGRRVSLYWAVGVAVVCGGLYAWRTGEMRGKEWEYICGAPWLWANRLLQTTWCFWEEDVYMLLTKMGLSPGQVDASMSGE